MHLVLPSEEFIISETRPRRTYMAFLVRWYTLIIAIFITIILVLTVVPYAPLAGAITILGYWVYYGLMQWVNVRKPLHGTLTSKNWQLARSLSLIVAVTVLLTYLYLGTDFLSLGGADHTLWLLLLLAALIVIKRGPTEYVVIAVFCAAASLIFTTLLGARVAGSGWITEDIALDLLAKIAWLTLLSLILHLSIRFVSNLYADVRLLHQVADEMLEQEQNAITASRRTSVQEIVQRLVDRIAADYGYPEVNFLESLRDGSLQFMAASSPAGVQLVADRFRLWTSPSIILKAARTQEPICANDVQRHPDYRAHALFWHTKSELAIPVVRQGRLLGVLDIQAHHRHAFMDHDLEVMGIFAGQLARAVENVRAHEWRRRSSDIIRSIACKLLSENELGGTLQEIADSARVLLEADVVILYERNPTTSVVGGPTWAGHLRYPQLIGRPHNTPDGLLARLFADTAPAYYHSHITGETSDPIFQPDSRHRKSGRSSFEQREEVKARAIIRLAAGYENVGIMFVNFRHQQEFPPSFCESVAVFANLAALAIRQAQLNERELELQRKELAGQVHDHFGAITRHAGRGISLVLERGMIDKEDYQRLSGCKDALDEMQRHIKFLHGALEDVEPRPLSAEVEVIASRVRKIYGIRVDVDWQNCIDDLLTRFGPQCKLILDELVINAVLHGEATHLSLKCTSTDGQICFEVKDNGRGFDQTHIRPSGLNHVHERAIRLGGNCVVESAPGKGARVRVQLPLFEEE
jgi:signal transduction histidine kinase